MSSCCLSNLVLDRAASPKSPMLHMLHLLQNHMAADRTFFGRTLLLRVYIEPHDGPNTISSLSKVMHSGVVLYSSI